MCSDDTFYTSPILLRHHKVLWGWFWDNIFGQKIMISSSHNILQCHLILATTSFMLIIFILYCLMWLTSAVTSNLKWLKQQHSISGRNVVNTANTMMIQTCCDVSALYFCTKPSGVYHMESLMDCWCGGKWNIVDVFWDTDSCMMRQDGTVDFNQSWVGYEKGFGDLSGMTLGL